MPLYSICPLGAGDDFLARGLLGLPVPTFSPPIDAAVTAYVERVRAARATVGFVENACCHCWHGARRRRRYEDRAEILVRHQFDPATDVAVEGGVLEWATDKPDLHAEVRDYFAGRAEDDADDPLAADRARPCGYVG